MLLPPPVPAPVAFHQLLYSASSSSPAHHLTDATAAQNRVRSTLKATKKDSLSDGRGADWAGAARAIAEYLPHLYAILAGVEADDLLLRTDPAMFAWRATLSSQTLKKGNKRVPLPSLHYELTATLLAYALCLANQASTLVASLGSYEIASSVSSSSIKVHDETINQAANTLCRASGVLVHLAEVVVPRWETAVGVDALRQRPVEMSREVATALSKMCLADANLLAIRRLLSRSLSVAHSTTTPGPPLPPAHPSPSLLAKLHLQVYTLYDESRSIIKSLSSSHSSGEISPLLRRYLSDGRALSLALSYKWLGVDAGERSATGDALGYLAMARKALDELREKDKGFGKIKGLAKRNEKAGRGRKGKVLEEVESTEAFASAYKKVNDSVHFQPIPSPQTLQSRLPAGRSALTLKPYTAPAPAFRPTIRSSGGGAPLPPPKIPPPPSPASAQLEGGFGGLSLAGAAEDSSDEDDDEGQEVGDYFGAGQYF
ncbi:hypothetical protein JCM6882_002054 [Rhodosporidiobolus microsporus]